MVLVGFISLIAWESADTGTVGGDLIGKVKSAYESSGPSGQRLSPVSVA